MAGVNSFEAFAPTVLYLKNIFLPTCVSMLRFLSPCFFTLQSINIPEIFQKHACNFIALQLRSFTHTLLSSL